MSYAGARNAATFTLPNTHPYVDSGTSHLHLRVMHDFGGESAPTGNMFTHFDLVQAVPCDGTVDAELTLSNCADYNDSGSVTSADATAFDDDYYANRIAADINLSGTVTSSDYTAFYSLYASGCP